MIKRNCKNCGKEFVIKNEQHRYCSNKCYIEGTSKEKREKRKLDDILMKEYFEKHRPICKVCGKKFKPKNNGTLYCSKECREKQMIDQSPLFRLRFDILERDGFTCMYCGNSPRKNPEVKLHIDHINPKSNGGQNDKSNLITACQYCNIGKGAKFYPEIFKLDYFQDLK